LNKFLIAVFLILIVIGAESDLIAADTLRITSSSLESSDGIILDSNWRYQIGDDIKWASPDFDDSSWPKITVGFLALRLGEELQGNGWYRQYLYVDSALLDRNISLMIRQFGAMEVYLNGSLVHSIGVVGSSSTEERTLHTSINPPIEIKLDSRDIQLIAIRFSNHHADMISYGAGFSMWLMESGNALKYFRNIWETGLRHQMLFTALCLAFCLIAILMYVFPPRAKENLLFALFAIGSAGLCYFPIQANLSVNPEIVASLVRYLWVSILFASLFGLWFLYSLFYKKTPRILWLFVAVTGVMIFTITFYSQAVIYVVSMIMILESTRVVILSVIRKKNNAWIIFVGYILFGIACIYQMLSDLEILKLLIKDFYYYYMYGILALLISEAVFLARQFSHANIDLMDQLENVRDLSARTLEQERHAKEQDIKRSVLEKEVEFQKVQLEEAKKLEKAMSDLEAANTEIRETQSQLIQSEKMASMGMLVAGVAHEINTPVGAIRSMHNTLVRAFKKISDEVEDGCLDNCEIKDKLCKYLNVVGDANKIIESGSDRVAEIVKRLRSFARLDEAELLKADIHECIEDTLMLAHHELKHNVEIIREFGEIPPIPCFAGQLNQVFLNILINSRQAIQDKGWIRIKTSVENDQVVIRFTDNGDGIPADVVKKVFDPGFTTKGVGVGTGLGLSICYQIIQSHKGELSVESEEGKGTTFTIRLPMNLDKILGV